MTRESAIRARALLALALVLTGCNPPLVYNPQQPIAPNINDRSAPDLELRVYYDATRFDSVVAERDLSESRHVARVAHR